MIRFEKFIETVKTEIRLLCGDGYQIIIEPIPRNNGTEHTGIDCQRRCDFVIFRRTGNVRKWRVKVCSL